LTNHTNINQQKKLLTEENVNGCISVFFIDPNKKCYNLPSLNVIKESLIRSGSDDITQKTDFYSKYFNKTEMQNIILKSNFLPYLIDWNSEETCKDFVNYLKELFVGNEKMLKNYVLQKIKPSNLNLIEFIESTGNEETDKYEIISDLLESLSTRLVN